MQPGETYDTETFSGTVDGDAGTASFLDCSFDGADLSGLRADRARFSHCRFTEARAADLGLVDASVLDTDLVDCRVGALDASGAEIRRVRWTGGKVDFANLRAASLREVAFSGCEFADLDLQDARLTKVSFTDCRIGRLALSGAHLVDVDLSRAELAVVDGIGSLSGATVSSEQVHLLAAAFAEHLGLVIADSR